MILSISKLSIFWKSLKEKNGGRVFSHTKNANYFVERIATIDIYLVSESFQKLFETAENC